MASIHTLRAFVVLTILILVGCSSSPSPQSQTNAGEKPPSDKDKKIKPYDKVVTKEAVSDSGMFHIHRIDEKYFFEIPKEMLGKEMLLVSRISKTPQVGYGGEENNSEVVRWERKNDKILLRTISYINVASDSAPIARAVRAANFEEVIKAFPIASFNKDSSNVVIDVTDLLVGDVGILTPNRDVRRDYKIGGLDKERSFVEYAKSFPRNIEIENVLTFSSENPSQSAASRTMSFGMHYSMVLLPEKPMMPRLADPRVGYFSLSQVDYSRPEPEAVRRNYILRWRLEPKDTAAFLRGELVEPITPITYYLDPATPVQWRPWLKLGIESWNPAFEAAGFKNAVRCIDAPTPEQDPDWAPEDARYSVIRYFPSPVENAYGPNIHDPRTGEILESDIGWFHNVLKLQTGWFFAQAVSDPRSRKLPYSDSLMGALIATVAAHEFGHTIGFPHNMKSSNAYPVDSLRSKTFTAKYGTAPTIMDYARYNYIAQPGDDVDVFPKVGPYDHYATRWGYRPIIGASTSDDELDTLRAWASAAESDPMLQFGSQQWGMIMDPTAQTEDLGDDAVKASTYGIANLKRAMGYVYDAAYERGKDFALLQDTYEDIVAQFGRETGHVANIPGGVIINRKVFGSEGPMYNMVPKVNQRAAVTFLAENVFIAPLWLLDERIAQLLTPTAVATRIAQLQSRVLQTLVSGDKMLRMIDQETRFGTQAYSLTEFLDDVEKSVLTEIGTGKPIDYYRRSLQRTYVDELIKRMSKRDDRAPVDFWTAIFRGPDTYNTDVRALCRARLTAIRKRLQGSKSADAMTQAHTQDLERIIGLVLDPKS